MCTTALQLGVNCSNMEELTGAAKAAAKGGGRGAVTVAKPFVYVNNKHTHKTNANIENRDGRYGQIYRIE